MALVRTVMVNDHSLGWRDVSRGMILAAAEELFFQRSFDGVGMDAIGRASGIVGSGLYRHFRGKNEILAALFAAPPMPCSCRWATRSRIRVRSSPT
jgi:hypothetical protein